MQFTVHITCARADHLHSIFELVANHKVKHYPGRQSGAGYEQGATTDAEHRGEKTHTR